MKLLLSLVFWILIAGPVHAFDHSHRARDTPPKNHVVVINDGAASQVRYAGLQKDRQALAKYLGTLSAVTAADQERIRAGKVPVTYLAYDWKLNDVTRQQRP